MGRPGGYGTAAVIILTLAMPCRSQSPPLLPLAGTEQVYTIQPGDGLYRIARDHGVSFSALARANGIDDPNLIIAGRDLLLPTLAILPGRVEEGILVNIPEMRLYLFRGGELAGLYPVCVGLPTWKTPRGAFEVTSRVEGPAWYMPAELARREKIKREIIPPGPDNPLGDFWIGTSLDHTGIHGTNRPMSIGRSLSHGCVRMYPEHLTEVFERVRVGEKGEFLYRPVKAASRDGQVLLEVHPDVYGLVPDLAAEARTRIGELGEGVEADEARVAEALRRQSGVPVAVGKSVAAP